MESSGANGSFKIEKLGESNFHIWKQKVLLALAFRELEGHVSTVRAPTDPTELLAWNKNDAKARAIIGFTLNNEHLDQVRDVDTAAGMWKIIIDMFQRKTLLNCLNARRKFYSVKMADKDRVLPYINRVRQLASDLRAMDVEISDQEMAMTVLCGLTTKFDHLIVAIDAVADDVTLTMDFVKSRLLQEEERMIQREPGSPSGDSALVNQAMQVRRGRSIPNCNHCHRRGHYEATCWMKHPHLRPGEKGLVGMACGNGGDDKSTSDSENYICLVSRQPNVFSNDSTWIIDSGATAHMSFEKSLFYDLEEVPAFKVSMGDKSKLEACGRGSINVCLSVSGSTVKCTLHNVLFVPSLSYNLLSVGVMNKGDNSVSFEGNKCTIHKSNVLIAEGTRHNGLYFLDTSSSETESNKHVALVADLNLWHQRLAHVHVDGIRGMVRKGVVSGVSTNIKQNVPTCTACVFGKTGRAPIPKQGGDRCSGILDRVYTDVCGKLPVESIGGSRYFVTFTDDHSRYCWVYAIRSKSDVFKTFVKWLSMAEKQTGKSLKVLQSDNGGEYLSDEMKTFLVNRGIVQRLTSPGNPYQNGVAERLNRTLIDLVRAMMHHKDVSKIFWAEALSVAVHVRNRVTTRGLNSSTTPYQLMYSRKPNLSHLRVFGCRCWYKVGLQGADKLDPRARESILVGYARGSRGYKLWDTEERKTVVSRDVVFDEEGTSVIMNDDHATSDMTIPKTDPFTGDPDTGENGEGNGSPLQDGVPDVDEVGADPEEGITQSEGTTDVCGIRRSTRERRKPDWYEAAVALLSNAESDNPKSFSQAISGCDAGIWKDAMNDEHKSLMDNNAWKLVPRPVNRNVVSCKWIYRVKEEQKVDGCLGIRHKARLVARGFSQIEGLDYYETFAPVVKFTSVRVLLSLVSVNDLHLHQMDVITAFLNGDLDEEVFMEQPEGYEEGEPSQVVCLLRKALYGLKQAPRQWYAVIDEFFCKDLVMVRNPADDCMYVRHDGNDLLLIALYVDDLLIACSNMETLQITKKKLCKKFRMKDLGESHVILGMDIVRDHSNRTLMLCQSRYAEKVINRFGMGSAKGSVTPVDVGVDLSVPGELCGQPYREAIGALMYLMVGTRPDIAFPVGKLAKYVENPGVNHWQAVKRLLRYIIHTKTLGLRYGGTTATLTPTVYVDADWAGDHESRQSMSGCVVMMGGAAISWYARQQEVVALSSTESEYISLCSGVKETIWIRRLVRGIGNVTRIDEPTVLLTDNQGGMKLASNASVNRRTKHIDVRFHFTRQAVQDGTVCLEYCPTEEMVADMLTKGLGRVKLEKFVEGCGLRVRL